MPKQRRNGVAGHLQLASPSESYEVVLPPAALARLQLKNQAVVAAQAALSEAVADMLTMMDEPGVPTNVNVDTGVVTLTRVSADVES